MNPKFGCWYIGYTERTREYKFRFDGGYITVEAKNEEEARILAQAEAIKKGWSHEILPDTMEREELEELIKEKVDEIINAYQERTNTCKNLDEFDKMALDAHHESLAEFIIRVCQ